MTLTRTDLSRTVAEIVVSDDSLIDDFAQNLPATDLAPVLVRATAIRRALSRLEKAIEVRYALEVAAPFTDEEGVEYEWRGTSKKEIRDVPSFLMECLTDPKITPAALLPAVSGLRLTPLNELAKKSGIVAHALAEWATYSEGPKHLTAKTKKDGNDR